MDKLGKYFTTATYFYKNWMLHCQNQNLFLRITMIDFDRRGIITSFNMTNKSQTHSNEFLKSEQQNDCLLLALQLQKD